MNNRWLQRYNLTKINVLTSNVLLFFFLLFIANIATAEDAKKKETPKKQEATDKKSPDATKDDKNKEKAGDKEKKAEETKPAPVVSVVPKFIKFRLGDIIAAEFTNKKIAIKNLNKFDMPKLLSPKKEKEDDTGFGVKKNYAFAIVAFKLNQGRSIGIYDYVLSDGNDEFKGIALSKNKAEFDTKNWVIKKTRRGDIVRVLYEIQVPSLTAPKIKLKLINKVLPGKEDKIPIPFRNLNGDDFTPTKKFPSSGALFVEKVKVEEKKHTGALPADIGPSL